jgi:hypothetical protein
MFFIASTRFNNSTWNENISYRIKYSIKGAIYGVPIKIYEKYPLNAIVFVVEMNNDTNQICGISVIRNVLSLDKKYRIYSENNYNRFVYTGDYWVSREELCIHNSLLVTMLENMMFKKKSNLKRLTGISFLRPKLYVNWKYDENYVKQGIKNIFITKFKQ